MSGKEGNAITRNGRMTESKMTTATLGGILELQRGYDLPTSQMKPGNVPVAGSNGVIGYHDTSRADAPAITIGRSGSAGKVHYYDNPIWPHNTSLFVTDFKGNDPLYVYYLLSSLDFSNYCGSSVVPSLNRNVIYPILVDYHAEIDEQRRVVGVLSAIDRKIALNRKRIATLEAMAKEIYDYWFVQFDFPDAHGRPYKSSGGAMVYNPDLKREIPKGWEVKPLGDIATFRNGINYDKSEIGDAEYRIVNVRNISESTFLIRHKDLDKIILRQTLADRFLLGSGDIIVARSGTPGATRIILNPERTIFCGFIICCSPIQDAHRILLAQRLQSIQRSLLDTSGGSILKNVSQDTLKSIPVELPPDDVLCRFNETMLTVIRSIDSAQKSAVEMADLRDFLLPLLMNGQVKVG